MPLPVIAIALLWWQGQAPPRHLQMARDLVAVIKPEQTSYRHDDTLVTWPEGLTKAECRTDCSGFWNVLITRAYPSVTTERLEGWLGKKRPRAEDYFAVMHDEKGFRLRKRVRDILAGDFIAIRYEKGAGNTGHTMIVDELPKLIDPVAHRYSVLILDATSSPHGAGDSRGKGTGLGRGTIRLDANADGTFLGHAWSLSPKAVFRPMSLRPMLIGEFDISTVPRIEARSDSHLVSHKHR
jgi:hypothetical protein